MRVRTVPTIVATVVALLGACSSPSSAPTTGGHRPSPEASSPSKQHSVVLLSDDFSDRAGGWPVGSPASMDPQALSYGYARGQYMISIAPGKKLGFYLSAPVNKTSRNVRIDVDVRELGQPAVWGVYCNGDGRSRSFYTFTVGLEDSWGIGRVYPGGGELLAKGPASGSIRPGSPATHLTATCRSDWSRGSVSLSMRVDGKEVLHAMDRNGPVGKFHSVPGLYIESSSFGDVQVLFDNFVFRALA